MSRQWFSLVPTADISISDISQVDISNIKAIFELKQPNLDPPGSGTYTALFNLNIESNNWNQIYGDPSNVPNWENSLQANYAYWVYCRPSETMFGSIDLSNMTCNSASILYTCNVAIHSLEIILNNITLSCSSGVIMNLNPPPSALYYNNDSIIISQFNTIPIALTTTQTNLCDISFTMSDSYSIKTVKFMDSSGNLIPNIAKSSVTYMCGLPPQQQQQSALEQPVIEQPVIEQPVIEQPVVELEQPVVELEQPVVELEQPVVEQPVVELEPEFITLDISNITGDSIDIIYKTNFDWRSFELVLTGIDVESVSKISNINIPIHIKNSKTIIGIAIDNNNNIIKSSNNFKTLCRLNYKSRLAPSMGIQTATIIDCNLKIKYPYPGLAEINPILPYSISNPLYPIDLI